MRRLTVLYDANCGFCIRCRHWLEKQPKFVELDFLPAQSREAERRLPGLNRPWEDELTVVSDEGGVYRGTRAWILCLWALTEYREWALTLARPALLPLARSAFEMLSRNRKGLSHLLRLDATDQEVARVLGAVAPAECDIAQADRVAGRPSVTPAVKTSR